MREYWAPSTKQELISWITNFYGEKQPGLRKKSKKVLYAIYFNIRNKIKG